MPQRYESTARNRLHLLKQFGENQSIEMKNDKVKEENKVKIMEKEEDKETEVGCDEDHLYFMMEI